MNKAKVYNTKPGLTGYRVNCIQTKKNRYYRKQPFAWWMLPNVILPYKGEAEGMGWSTEFYTDFAILFLTGWYIFFLNSKLVYKVFPSAEKGDILTEAEPVSAAGWSIWLLCLNIFKDRNMQTDRFDLLNMTCIPILYPGGWWVADLATLWVNKGLSDLGYTKLMSPRISVGYV